MKILRFILLISLIAGITGLIGCSIQSAGSSSQNSTQQATNTDSSNFASTTLVLEAENAAISGGTVSSSISGYSGAGYVAISGTAGSYVEWTFTANSAASASIKFYYTSSATASYDITVNGGSSTTKSFNSNSSWTSASKSFTLPAGTVKFRMTASDATSSGISIDRIEVTGDVSSGGSSSSVSSVASSASSSKSSSSSSAASSTSSSKSSSSSSVSSSSSSAASSVNFSLASLYTRQAEKLDRGLVAVKVSSGVYLSWRILGTEFSNAGYNIYRGSTKIA
jgi:hypothetical protein